MPWRAVRACEAGAAPRGRSSRAPGRVLCAECAVGGPHRSSDSGRAPVLPIHRDQGPDGASLGGARKGGAVSVGLPSRPVDLSHVRGNAHRRAGGRQRAERGCLQGVWRALLGCWAAGGWGFALAARCGASTQYTDRRLIVRGRAMDEGPKVMPGLLHPAGLGYRAGGPACGGPCGSFMHTHHAHCVCACVWHRRRLRPGTWILVHWGLLAQT